MNDAEFRAWCDRIDDRLLFWIPRMGLSHWTRDVTLHRNARDSDHVHPAGYGSPFVITADWRYMNFHLEAFVSFIHDCQPDAKALDRMIVHELWHCHAAELRAEVPEDAEERHTNHEERLVSMSTMVLCSLHEELEAWDAKQERRIKRLTAQLSKAKAA